MQNKIKKNNIISGKVNYTYKQTNKTTHSDSRDNYKENTLAMPVRT